jgi:uncharacterized protein (DUF302 family)
MVTHSYRSRRAFFEKTFSLYLCGLLPFKSFGFMNANGVIVRSSPYAVRDSIDKIEGFLKTHGATIYARINQQTEVSKAGQILLPLEFLLFGNPKVGATIMAENPLAALDLPLKLIAWEDTEQQVWIAYNESAYIEKRYSLHGQNPSLDIGRLVNAALKT